MSKSRTYVLHLLKQAGSAGVNTLEFRQRGAISPAPRIRELREAGFDIFASDEDVPAHLSPDGVAHEGIARYRLVSEPLTQVGAKE